jgi:hypothetical protein
VQQPEAKVPAGEQIGFGRTLPAPHRQLAGLVDKLGVYAHEELPPAPSACSLMDKVDDRVPTAEKDNRNADPPDQNRHGTLLQKLPLWNKSIA